MSLEENRRRDFGRREVLHEDPAVALERGADRSVEVGYTAIEEEALARPAHRQRRGVRGPGRVVSRFTALGGKRGRRRRRHVDARPLDHTGRGRIAQRRRGDGSLRNGGRGKPFRHQPVMEVDADSNRRVAIGIEVEDWRLHAHARRHLLAGRVVGGASHPHGRRGARPRGTNGQRLDVWIVVEVLDETRQVARTTERQPVDRSSIRSRDGGERPPLVHRELARHGGGSLKLANACADRHAG